jgi:hypothetical protein
VKPQIALQPEWRLLITRYPHIHEEDAWNALVTRATRKILNRSARTAEQVEEILEDIFLAVLADMPPEQWTDDTWQAIQERSQASKVGHFMKRLARAIEGPRRRTPLFDEVDLFLLTNWRVLRFRNPDNAPGLHAWHPRAVMNLLKREGVYCGDDVKWYQKRRHNLGLTPGLPYSVPKSLRTLPSRLG